MELTLRDYDLPDRVLYQDAAENRSFLVWRPDFTSIILGASNKPESSVKAEETLQDSIPVYKRPSGGEAVIVTPNTLVIAGVTNGVKLKQIRTRFCQFNYAVRDALIEYGIEGVHHSGISDLAIGDMKILGSAVYHSRDRLFYHAVLNVAESTEMISRYLSHPQREPDYRAGRKHGDFVTSLKLNGYEVDYKKLQSLIESYLERLTAELLTSGGVSEGCPA